MWRSPFSFTSVSLIDANSALLRQVAKYLSCRNNGIIKVFTTIQSYLITLQCIVSHQDRPGWNFWAIEYKSGFMFTQSKWEVKIQSQWKWRFCISLEMDIFPDRNAAAGVLYNLTRIHGAGSRFPLCRFTNELFMLMKCWLIELSRASERL